MFNDFPTIEEMIEFVITPIQWSFLIFPLISAYVTYAHYRWWKLYAPSPLIKHLLISSIAVDVSALIVAFIVANSFGIIPIDLPVGANTILLALALMIALGVKVYRRISLRALDRPDEDITQRVETQNQREDRQFGEERRALELEHLNGDLETVNQRDDREAGDEKRAAEAQEQDEFNDANQK